VFDRPDNQAIKSTSFRQSQTKDLVKCGSHLGLPGLTEQLLPLGAGPKKACLSAGLPGCADQSLMECSGLLGSIAFAFTFHAPKLIPGESSFIDPG
jgi:hypothetical protein